MLGAIGGGVVAFILFIVISILMYKRRKSSNVKKEVSDFSDTPYSDEEAGMYIKNINHQRITTYESNLQILILSFRGQEKST